MNMRNWLEQVKTGERKKAMPLLSYPSIQLLGVSVKELISDSSLQAKGMKLIADRVDSLAAVSMMDLSVEAEAFGAEIRVTEEEVPTVIGALVKSPEDAQALEVPRVGAGRTGLYLEAVAKACKEITDRPVLAGVIGPFSLAGRLMDVTEAMMNCYLEPEMVHEVLEKATEFLIAYIQKYKENGANGVVIAEPLTGMLSPDLAKEFSEPYVRKIVEAVQNEEFLVVYHNCGDNVVQMLDSILATGCGAYHFGDSIDMSDILTGVSADTVVMGNVSPAREFKGGTPASIKASTKAILEKCSGYPNFVISSGCDIPPMSGWDNIDAFFEAVTEFYDAQ